MLPPRLPSVLPGRQPPRVAGSPPQGAAQVAPAGAAATLAVVAAEAATLAAPQGRPRMAGALIRRAACRLAMPEGQTALLSMPSFYSF